MTIILWCTDPLLGNDHETNNKTKAIARQWPLCQWTGWKAVFSAGSVWMPAHTTVDASMMSTVCYAVSAKGLEVGQSLKISCCGIFAGR
jgi:hypothetical protein